MKRTFEQVLQVEFATKVSRVEHKRGKAVYVLGHASVQSPLLKRWAGRRVVMTVRLARKDEDRLGPVVIRN